MIRSQAVALATILAFGFHLNAAEKAVKVDAKTAEIMKKYELAATPGPQHKMLAAVVGKWKTSTKMCQTAESNPEVSTGTASFKMILGGRWLQQDFKGSVMGKAFNGLGIVGYDNIKGKYESYWFDSISTGAIIGAGDYDESTKTIKHKSVMSCPLSEDKNLETRNEWQIMKNKMIYTMYGVGPLGGREFKMVEVIYTR